MGGTGDRKGCSTRTSAAAAAGICLLAILLFHLEPTGAEPGQFSDKKSITLPSGKYLYTNPVSKINVTCDKCPAGTYVSKHCTQFALRECSPCPNGTFTRHENGNDRCHNCSPPCEPPMVMKMPCSALSDRECSCPSAMYLLNGTCVNHTVCPVGWGVRKKGSENENVKCKTCAHGTYSDVPSTTLRCKTQTNCSALGLIVLKPGTNERDNICGPISSPPSKDFYSTPADYEPTDVYNDTETNETKYLNMTEDRGTGHPQETPDRRQPQLTDEHPGKSRGGGEGLKSTIYKTTKNRPSRQVPHHFDINEHLPWMIVLFLLLVLVIIVVCSVRKSSRTLKKGPKQDPSSIVEKAGFKKSTALTQNREKWIYYCNGHGIDILKLVAAQVGSQWQDIYQFLCNANEHEVAAFSNGYTADHERAYAALQHWTIRGPEASLAKLISALRQHRRNDVVEKIRGLMEDTVQIEDDKPVLQVNPNQPIPTQDPSLKAPDSAALTIEPSPLDKNKGFFADESEPLLRCDSTSSGSSALSRRGSFITKEKKDTVLRQVRLDPCDLQPIFDDMLPILSPEEIHIIDEIPQSEDKLDRLFEIAGVKSQEASQKLLDSVYSHLPDLL
ncbi:tumor necrosis factor receptor superfamily member 21 [Phyllobates terribilis]|uniref:tumor necrosis factor receptor superfamily member 21 n=1 Tax=Phyllobates terribilis TaxID=111132 RepID=UPI003CCAB221